MTEEIKDKVFKACNKKLDDITWPEIMSFMFAGTVVDLNKYIKKLKHYVRNKKRKM